MAIQSTMIDAIVYFPQENAKALAEIKTKGVTIFDAPADYGPAWIKASKKVLDSQRAFARIVVPYGRETGKLSALIGAAAE